MVTINDVRAIKDIMDLLEDIKDGMSDATELNEYFNDMCNGEISTLEAMAERYEGTGGTLCSLWQLRCMLHYVGIRPITTDDNLDQCYYQAYALYDYLIKADERFDAIVSKYAHERLKSLGVGQ